MIAGVARWHVLASLHDIWQLLAGGDQAPDPVMAGRCTAKCIATQIEALSCAAMLAMTDL
jgi:hypothetical protein